MLPKVIPAKQWSQKRYIRLIKRMRKKNLKHLFRNKRGWARWQLAMYGEIKAKCPQAILECPVVVRGNLFFVDVGLRDKLVYFEYDGCYDKETEVLTESGWKLFKDVSFTDKILSMNPETFEMEYLLPTNNIKIDYTGKVYNINNSGLKLRVTSNHNILIRHRGASKYTFDIAEEVFDKKIYYKYSGVWKGEDIFYFNLPEVNNGHNQIRQIKMVDWLNFFGWWIAEGSLSKGLPYAVFIFQSTKSPYLEDIENAIKSLGFHYDKQLNNQGNYVFRISSKQLHSYLSRFGLAYQKYIPVEIKSLSSNLLNIFLKSYGKGDGHWTKDKKRIVYLSTTSKRLADDLQEITIKCGYHSHLSTQQPRTTKIENRIILAEHCKKSYRVNLCPHSEHLYQYRLSNTTTENVLSEPMFCLELPKYHTLMVRRKGKAVWCGNSEWHKDKEHDLERDKLLATFGWKGFHFNKDNFYLIHEDLDGILKSLTR